MYVLGPIKVTFFPVFVTQISNILPPCALRRSMPPWAMLMGKTKGSGSKLKTQCILVPETGKENSPDKNKTH